jgi:5-methylcytosine-specific restriction enzyme subunit McrC
LRERSITLRVELAPEEIRALRAARAGLRILATDTPGKFDIETSQYVGTFSGPRIRVFIEPKLPVGRVLYLLGYIHDAERMLKRAGTYGGATGLVEVMQVLYCRALEQGLRSGLVRGYERHREELVSLRGRVDANVLVLRRFGIFPPIPCEFDELTTDTEPNRRLLAAAHRLARLESGRQDLVQTLRRLASAFDGVSRINYSGRLLPLAKDQRYGAFGFALILASLVLENSSLELRDGRLEAMGLLVNMEDLYEKFATKLLGEILRDHVGQWAHRPGDLFMESRERVKLTPDVVWWQRKGQPQLVLDAKYKSTVGGSSQDLYQMSAYCMALGLRHGVLLYAEAEETTHVVNMSGVHIHILRLDLSGEPEDIHARARRLAGRLAQLAAENLRARRE